MIPREVIKKKLQTAQSNKSHAYLSDNDVRHRYFCCLVRILEDILDSDLDFEGTDKKFLRYHKKYHPKKKIKLIESKGGKS